MGKNLINKRRQKQDGFKLLRLEMPFYTVYIWRLKNPGKKRYFNTDRKIELK